MTLRIKSIKLIKLYFSNTLTHSSLLKHLSLCKNLFYDNEFSYHALKMCNFAKTMQLSTNFQRILCFKIDLLKLVHIYRQVINFRTICSAEAANSLELLENCYK